MNVLPWLRRIAAALAVLAGVTILGAAAYDRAEAGTFFPGMRIDGVAIGGLTRGQALVALERPAADEESRGITVRAGGLVIAATPASLGAHVDLEAALDEAGDRIRGLGFFDRVLRRLRGGSFESDIPLRAEVDADALRRWVADVADRVDATPEDAVFELVDGNVVLQPSVVGRSVDQPGAVAALRTSILEGGAQVTLPVAEVRPTVDGTALGKTIVVDISANTLVLYEGTTIERRYRVATGAPGYPTPLGSFEIIRKLENPTWVNPDPEGWGKDYPASIGPGPGNPLGTRALYLNAPGIRIHGTYNSSSIGTFASHGCIRMLISDSEALYPLVPVGARVFIVA